MSNNTWVCIGCGKELGTLLGRELVITNGTALQTQGANLVVSCPVCSKKKVWYPSDQVLRAMNQLIDALATAMAKAAIQGISTELYQLRQQNEKPIGEEDNA